LLGGRRASGASKTTYSRTRIHKKESGENLFIFEQLTEFTQRGIINNETNKLFIAKTTQHKLKQNFVIFNENEF